MFSEMPEIAQKSVTALRKPDANAYAEENGRQRNEASLAQERIKAARCFLVGSADTAVPESVSNAFQVAKVAKDSADLSSIISKDERDDFAVRSQNGVSMNERRTCGMLQSCICFLVLESGVTNFAISN